MNGDTTRLAVRKGEPYPDSGPKALTDRGPREKRRFRTLMSRCLAFGPNGLGVDPRLADHFLRGFGYVRW
jgi:hypothetical protein